MTGPTNPIGMDRPMRQRKIENPDSGIYAPSPAADTVRLHAVIALLTTLLLTVEYWCFGPYSAMYGYGGGLETIPVYRGLALTHSTQTFWAPFVAGGVDRLSFWGNADPYNLEPLLFTFLPTWVAAGLHLFLQRFVPIFIVMRVAETQIRLPGLWPMVAGIVYGCLSYPTPGYMLAEASIAVAIWLIPHLVASRHPWSGAVVLGAVLASMSSFIWSQPFVPLFVTAWFAVVLKFRGSRFYAVLALTFLVQALLDAPQMLALFANAPSSHRADWPVERLDWSWSGLLYFQSHYDLFNQDHLLKALTIGIPPAAIAIGVLGCMTVRTDARRGLFLRMLAIYAVISLKVLLVGGQELAAHWLPWIRGVFMGRFYMVPAPFLVPMMATTALFLASCGASRLVQRLPEKRRRFPARAGWTLLGIFLCFLTLRPKVFLFNDLLIDGWGSQNYEVAALSRITRAETRPFRVASVLPLQPAYAYGQGLETADGWANLYPAVYRDLWLRIIAPGLSQLPGMKQVLDPDNARPQDHYIFLNLDLITPNIGRLPGEDPAAAMSKGFDLDRRLNLPLLSILNVRYILSALPVHGHGLTLISAPSHPPRAPFSKDYATGRPNTPGAPHIRISKPSDVPAAIHALKQAIARRRHGKEIYIYRNDAALERFHLVTAVVVEPSDSAVLDHLSTAPPAILASTAFLAPDAAAAVSGNDPWSPGSVTVESYTPDDITLTAHFAGKRAFLVIANTWNPYWTADVDGKPRRLVRVNHAQYGLPLREGDSRIGLHYRPPYHWVPLL